MPTEHKEDLVKTKAAKRGIVEQKPLGSKNKSPKPYVLECRRVTSPSLKPMKGEWRKWGAYRSEAQAIQTKESMQRKILFYEWRLSPKNPTQPQ